MEGIGIDTLHRTYCVILTYGLIILRDLVCQIYIFKRTYLTRHVFLVHRAQIHDNPQLGSSAKRGHALAMDSKLHGEAGDEPRIDGECNGNSNTPAETCAPTSAETNADGMEIMLESKGDDGFTYFLLAHITYSGSLSGVDGADHHNPRGGQCMACRNLLGFRVDLKKCLTRVVDSGIVELELSRSSTSASCEAVTLVSAEQVEDFLSPCTSRVDVILAPSRTGDWYPYWEGKRKMAPQFRSKGVGYLRCVHLTCCLIPRMQPIITMSFLLVSMQTWR